jgi:hypothetical protein
MSMSRSAELAAEADRLIPPARGDPSSEARVRDLLAALMAVDEAAALFVVHDLNPRALASRIGGFVQSRNWFQDYTPVTIRSS